MKYLRGFGFFINTIILYLAIPLFGWGLDDLRGFFSSPPRLGYCAVICFVGLIVGFQAVIEPKGIHGSSGKKGKLIHSQRIIRIAVSLLLIFSLAFLPFSDRRNVAVMMVSATACWIGLILFTIGILFVLWSGISLGKFYSADVTIQDGHQLIMNDLYRYIRHPRYLGGILSGFGLSLLFRSWIGLFANTMTLSIPFCIPIDSDEQIDNPE
jgi:protein-S-isoprenylcysteine O-methyltransferase Ste14